MQNERSAGVDRAVTHSGRTVTVARVPRRTDASRASIVTRDTGRRPLVAQASRVAPSVKSPHFVKSDSKLLLRVNKVVHDYLVDNLN